MNKILLDNNNYELIKDYKNGFDLTELQNKYTDYFNDYDYIVGDWSYGKLRLKGFCDKKNKLFNTANNYSIVDKYIKDKCSYDCRYFIVKKSSN